MYVHSFETVHVVLRGNKTFRTTQEGIDSYVYCSIQNRDGNYVSRYWLVLKIMYLLFLHHIHSLSYHYLTRVQGDRPD